jgi:hypothetical protein
MVTRLRYWQGQALRARDLRDEQASRAELRWWHDRALHDAFGVRFGLGAALATGGASPTLTVGSGLAYDAFGREIVLPGACAVSVPDAPARAERVLTLLVRHGADPRAGRRETRAGCTPPPAAEPPPRFVWKDAEWVDVRDGVPLASIRFAAGVPTDVPFRAPVSRPAARPHLAVGSTLPGNTAWEPWTVAGEDGPRPVGMQTAVDTEIAGFARTPRYVAMLAGPLWEPPDDVFIPAFFTHVAAPSPTGFVFRLLMPPSPRLRLRAVGTEGEATTAGLRLRLRDVAALRAGDGVVLESVETDGTRTSRVAIVEAVERDGHVTFGPDPAAAAGALDLPAGRLTVAASYNARFADEFPLFARRRRLAVCWIGCEEAIDVRVG